VRGIKGMDASEGDKATVGILAGGST
jgi:hypothetical protein